MRMTSVKVFDVSCLMYCSSGGLLNCGMRIVRREGSAFLVTGHWRYLRMNPRVCTFPSLFLFFFFFLSFSFHTTVSHSLRFVGWGVRVRSGDVTAYAQIGKQGFESSLVLASALLDFYSKCGELEGGLRLAIVCADGV